MQCPVCDVTLQMTDRQGIEIDYCPQCRGIWLDRGELDKLIERSMQEAGGAQAPRTQPDHRGHHQGKHPKKKSLLKELLDF
ncbi:zf-TFIIB domain-containing protein [Ectothiorhodospiraceae bacterium WFHF3C12]|nr:zf-TFIIB domain-containing protein [Ectothiorhodospiraceae bacterium WFHF3C12]